MMLGMERGPATKAVGANAAAVLARAGERQQ
eukprot:COSAG01_NODE_37723_length_499_cov_2.240000_1_plen_30_part_10